MYKHTGSDSDSSPVAKLQKQLFVPTFLDYPIK